MQTIEVNTTDMDFRTEEAFKTLRSNIEFLGDDIRTICVTSCTPNEGKSSISFDLACSFAQNGKKVLLVDADLRRSVMRQRHRKGKVKLGLSNYLVGKTTLEECICVTDVKNLCLIFSGPVPPNPSELLGNARFKDLLVRMRELFDMIIVDTAPLGSVIDAAIVAKCCDGAMLVIESGAISYRYARKVKEQLEMSGCRLLGCVLNKVDIQGKSYYGKYYGKYYGSYERTEGKDS